MKLKSDLYVYIKILKFHLSNSFNNCNQLSTQIRLYFTFACLCLVTCLSKGENVYFFYNGLHENFAKTLFKSFFFAGRKGFGDEIRPRIQRSCQRTPQCAFLQQAEGCLNCSNVSFRKQPMNNRL